MYGNTQLGQNTDDVVKLRQEAGLWLRSLREDAGLSQRDLSRHLNLDHYTFISQIESGRGRVPPTQYEAYANAVKVQPHDFARAMLRFYDPITHRMLFSDKPKKFSDISGIRPPPEVGDLAKRLARLEGKIARQAKKDRTETEAEIN